MKDSKVIHALKNNKYPFGLMTEEMQAKAQEINEGFEVYLTGEWHVCGSAKEFDLENAYRLRPDYSEKPKVVECEIKVYEQYGEILRYKKSGNAAPYDIYIALSDPDFIGFKYENGETHAWPRVYSKGGSYYSAMISDISGYEVLTPTSVLFRSKL